MSQRTRRRPSIAPLSSSWPGRCHRKPAARSKRSPPIRRCCAPSWTTPFSRWIWAFSRDWCWALRNFSGDKKNRGQNHSAPRQTVVSARITQSQAGKLGRPQRAAKPPKRLRKRLILVRLQRQPQLLQRLVNLVHCLGAIPFKVPGGVLLPILAIAGFNPASRLLSRCDPVNPSVHDERHRCAVRHATRSGGHGQGVGSRGRAGLPTATTTATTTAATARDECRR